jgi:hypothetical protein
MNMSAETHSIHINTTSPVEVKKSNLRELLQWPLAIPEYQRRYCWKQEQVSLLLKDIERLLSNKRDPPLFLGTVILHLDDNKAKANLVDGQQRCLTLVLLLKALRDLIGDEDKEPALTSLLQAKFSDSQTQQCLAANYQQLRAYLQADANSWYQDQKKLRILMEKMEFVVITISSIDQAFAFFDCQNSAGKRLSDFDLLKARHLRGIVSPPEVGIGCSRIWEEYENLRAGNGRGPRLAYYLTECLLARTRVRQRNTHVDKLKLEHEFAVLTGKSSGKTETPKQRVQLSPPTSAALYRDWQVIYTPEETKNFPFTFATELGFDGGNSLLYQLSKVTHLPLQLHQSLVGGEQFFFYVAKYTEIYKQLFPRDLQDKQVEDKSGETGSESGVTLRVPVWEQLLARHRFIEGGQNAGYSRLIDIWLSLIVFYTDRFDIYGHEETSDFERFVWLSDQYVFSLRITANVLRRSTIENHCSDNHLFSNLLQLPTPQKVIELIENLIKKQAIEVEKVHEDIQRNGKKGVRWHYIEKFYLDSFEFSHFKQPGTTLNQEVKKIIQSVIQGRSTEKQERAEHV